MANNKNRNGNRNGKHGSSPNRRHSSNKNASNSTKGVVEGQTSMDQTRAGGLDLSGINPTLATQVSSVLFNYRNGDPIPGNFGNLVAASCITYPFTPTLGTLNGYDSPANVAALAVNSYTRSMVSGSRTYDPADVMIYLMAMDSIYMLINEIQRAINVAQYRNIYSKGFPEVLMRGLQIENFDYAKTVEYSTELNFNILNAATRFVPNVFPLYATHAAMCMNVYVDDVGPKSPYFVFVPDTYYKYALDSEGKGMLKAIANPSTMNGKLTLLKEMVDIIYDSYDISQISGDLANAYGIARAFTLTPYMYSGPLSPVYDEVVNHEVHNLNTCGYSVPSDIVQVIEEGLEGYTGYLKQELRRDVGLARALDMYGEDYENTWIDARSEPTNEDVLHALRWTTMDWTATDQEDIYIVGTYGSEVMGEATVYHYDPDTPSVITGDYLTTLYDSSTRQVYNNMVTYVSDYTHAPKCILVNNMDLSEPTVQSILWNRNNTTSVSYSLIRAMQRAIMLGLFNVERLTLKQ